MIFPNLAISKCYLHNTWISFQTNNCPSKLKNETLFEKESCLILVRFFSGSHSWLDFFLWKLFFDHDFLIMIFFLVLTIQWQFQSKGGVLTSLFFLRAQAHPQSLIYDLIKCKYNRARPKCEEGCWEWLEKWAHLSPYQIRLIIFTTQPPWFFTSQNPFGGLKLENIFC